MGLGKLIARVKRRIVRKKFRPSSSELDSKLEKYLNFRDGFFIEAGANDGYSQSNTYFLETEKGWTGLLVEGIPALYKKCRKLRNRSKVYNCALVGNDFQLPTIKMHFANLMSVVDGALKTEEEKIAHINDGIKVQKLRGSYSIEVKARTLESILDDLPECPVIDFFSLDVEGFELDVLKGLNLDKYRPRYILVEARYFDEVNSFLLSKDYELLEKLSCHDYLYCSPGIVE